MLLPSRVVETAAAATATAQAVSAAVTSAAAMAGTKSAVIAATIADASYILISEESRSQPDGY